MMDGNLLLYWLSHSGEGTWSSFQKAVELIGGRGAMDDEELRKLTRALRFGLADLAHIDFFQERRRWRIRPPRLVAFAEDERNGLLCGGRSPAFLAQLARAAAARGCLITTSPQGNLPDKVSVSGPPESLRSVALEIGARYSADFAAELCSEIVSIDSVLATAPVEEPPINWERQFFDLRNRRWTADPLARTVCEYKNDHGERKYLLHVSRRKAVRLLQRREAIHAAAAVSGTNIVIYDERDKTLRTPMYAALPEACARLACLSSGGRSVLDNGFTQYNPVPPRIAHIILAAIGQDRS